MPSWWRFVFQQAVHFSRDVVACHWQNILPFHALDMEIDHAAGVKSLFSAG